MRDYLIVGLIVGASPFCFFYPYLGVLLWTWISYFSPHRYAYGFAYNFPVAIVVAIPTLAGAIFTRSENRQRPFFTRELILLTSLWCWFGVTLVTAMNVPLFAGHVDDAKVQMIAVSKILLMTYVTVLLVNTPERMRNLVIVVALSFGVRSLFGGLFGFRTGGQFKVYGPPDTFIEDNNDFALALNMVLAMMYFLARTEPRRWLRLFFWACFVSGIMCVLLSYSRGGLLGLVATAGLIALKSKKKVLAGTAIVVAAMFFLTFATSQWKDRMGNFAEGNLDDSARQRLVSWGFALHLMEDYPITGGGFMTFPDENVFQRYARAQLPGGFQSTGPHSIYFQLLGEQGFVGLGLFLCLVISMLFSLRSIRRMATSIDSTHWLVPYTSMLQAGLAAYLISGAFLGRAYFDLFYQLVALTVILKAMATKEIAKALRAEDSAPSGEIKSFEQDFIPVEM
jgi:probable O-glycosylation ligase (exosortase A-associated)